MARNWTDLSPRTRKLIIAAGAIELSAKAAALIDIKRRPAARIRGPKQLWAAAQAINGIGPLAYFTLGRRRGETR